jgi:modulator of FtsH protease
MKTNHNLTTHKRSATAQSVAVSNKLNPYMLLSVTLLLPAVIIAASAAMKLPLAGIIVTLLAYFGLLFLTARMLNKGSMFPNRNN